MTGRHTTRVLLAAVALTATLAGPAVAGDIQIWQPQRVDPFNDPRFPLRHYDPLVQRNGNGVTIYQAIPGTGRIPDLNAPAYNYSPNNGSSWTIPPPAIDPFGYDDE